MTPKEQIEILKRGVVETITEEELLRKISSGKVLRVKLGVDPTAPDIHLGHTVTLRKLRQFQELGHEAILIIGDFTGMIGDPSDRKKMRPQLSHEEVMENCKAYEKQVFKILDKPRTRVVFNGEWFKDLPFEKVLSLCRFMTLARMLEREDFQNRFKSENPIGIHELLYPLMQGYDSVQIQADVELGGTDQKFNILVGRDLQREHSQEPQVAMLLPILLGTDGHEKMSKTLQNHIPVDAPPEDMYGKLMSIPDELMKSYFELLTDVPLPEIEKMEKERKTGKQHPKEMKEKLAFAAVSGFYGEKAGKQAGNHFEKVFRKKEIPDEIPVFTLSKNELSDGKIWICKLLTKAGLAKSNGEAKRLISQGGISIGRGTAGMRVRQNPDEEIEIHDALTIKVGKRRFVKIQIAP